MPSSKGSTGNPRRDSSAENNAVIANLRTSANVSSSEGAVLNAGNLTSLQSVFMAILGCCLVDRIVFVLRVSAL
jgi:hypothetical protein